MTHDMIYTIPKGTPASKCPRHCGANVYWIERHRSISVSGKPVGTVRIPVDTSPGWAVEPDSLSDGKGCHHFDLCTAYK